MLKSTCVAAAMVLTVTSAGPVLQQTGPGSATPIQSAARLHLDFTLSCFSFQAGGDAPGVQLTNDGPGTVPAGTVAHWVVGASNGDYTFPNTFEAHRVAVLNGVARTGLGACSIRVIRLGPAPH